MKNRKFSTMELEVNSTIKSVTSHQSPPHQSPPHQLRQFSVINNQSKINNFSIIAKSENFKTW